MFIANRMLRDTNFIQVFAVKLFSQDIVDLLKPYNPAGTLKSSTPKFN